jgi:hypothetical protein
LFHLLSFVYVIFNVCLFYIKQIYYFILKLYFGVILHDFRQRKLKMNLIIVKSNQGVGLKARISLIEKSFEIETFPICRDIFVT